MRFQVCLPTPMGVIYAFCTERDVLAIDAAYERAMVREVERLCRAIPREDLCLQWDFCHEMIILDGQPQTQFPTVKASLQDIMARMARLAAAVQRPITYLHMPVPIGRSDDAFFLPLEKLSFEGELYLGVVHAADGVEGTKKRMAAAAKHAPKFGIACECGIARARKPELIRRLLEIHSEAAK